MLETFEHRWKPDPNKVHCPCCHGLGSGPMASFQLGFDEQTGEYVHRETKDICEYCDGTGWVKKCPTCGGSGGIKECPSQ